MTIFILINLSTNLSINLNDKFPTKQSTILVKNILSHILLKQK